ncbi:hypothetical protein SLE2022_331800 [Rubroshorea leprosula]
MSLSLKKLANSSILVQQYKESRLCSSLCHGRLYTTTELFSLDQGRRLRERGSEGEQEFFLCGRSVPLSRLLHSCGYYSFHNSSCQVPCFLPHPSGFSNLQEKMPVILPYSRISLLPNHSLQGNVWNLSFRGFSSGTDCDMESDSENGNESDDVNDGEENVVGSVKSGADPNEVERVCKVIDELFTLDRNMEAVLDECDIALSHDLVIDVLERFKHARKPAVRFFCWAGQKPGFAHDSRTYNAMMGVLARTRQFESMVAMLEEMGTKGLLTKETFVIAIKAFAAAKERKKAVAIFELMKKYKYTVGAETINFLLDSLGKAKLGKEAQALFDKLKGRFTPNLGTYTVLINGWCKVKNLVEAGRLWNEMIDVGIKPDIVAHNIMLEGLLKTKKRSEAIKLFTVMKSKGPLPTVQSYTIMIRDFCKQSKMNDAVEYFDEMLGAGCQPDNAVYTCLITGFGNQKRMDMVYASLKEMKEKGCPPDGCTYNALIKLLANQRMPDDAARVYKKMIHSGIQPTVHTFNMMMKSFFQDRNYEMGYAIWEEMSKKGICPDDNSYTVFIGGLIRLGRSGDACKYLEEMLEKGMKAPQLDYNKFVADFARAGKPDILEELAQKMKFSGKFEVSNVFARWAEMMKKRVKRRGPFKVDGQCT